MSRRQLGFATEIPDQMMTEGIYTFLKDFTDVLNKADLKMRFVYKSSDVLFGQATWGFKFYIDDMIDLYDKLESQK